jgi:hypothetical protein
MLCLWCCWQCPGEFGYMVLVLDVRVERLRDRESRGMDVPHWAEFAKEIEELFGSDVEAVKR